MDGTTNSIVKYKVLYYRKWVGRELHPASVGLIGDTESVSAYTGRTMTLQLIRTTSLCFHWQDTARHSVATGSGVAEHITTSMGRQGQGI